MNEMEQYVKDAIKTESLIDNIDIDPRILHGVIGLSTEAGELLDNLKKTIFYGKELDKVNLAEEIGDAMWYLAILCDSLDVSFESVCETNITKLKKRYPDKFTSEDALNRNLKEEREVLDDGFTELK